jgi:hypothetical protein
MKPLDLTRPYEPGASVSRIEGSLETQIAAVIGALEANQSATWHHPVAAILGIVAQNIEHSKALSADLYEQLTDDIVGAPAEDVERVAAMMRDVVDRLEIILASTSGSENLKALQEVTAIASSIREEFEELELGVDTEEAAATPEDGEPGAPRLEL